MTILKRMIVLMATLMGAMGLNLSGVIPDAAAAPNKAAKTNVADTRFYGACGGGTSLADMMAGWERHGVLDDVARSAGQTPGLDGSAANIVRDGIVEVVVVRGGYVRNFTCKGGSFSEVSKLKYISAGSRYFVPERLAPKPCTQKRVFVGWEAKCGNKQLGNLLVRRACAFVPKPKPAPKQAARFGEIVKRTPGYSKLASFRGNIKFQCGSVLRAQSFRIWNDGRVTRFRIPSGCFVQSVKENGAKGWKLQSARRSGNRWVITNIRVVQTGPILIAKSCEDADLRQLVAGCPTNTFTFNVTTSDGKVWNNVPYNLEVGKDSIEVGRCVVGTTATATENAVNGWKVADGVKNPQTLTCTASGVRFVFKNQQVRPPAVATPPPVVSTPKSGEPGPGTTTPGTPGGGGSGGTPAPPSDPGGLCRDTVTGDIRSGKSDQFGYCV